MKPTYIVVALMTAFLTKQALAADFEIAGGKTANTINNAYSIGLTGKASDTWRWRVGYANLGAPKINLLASPDSAADDIEAGKGTSPYYWIQPVDIKEWYATIAKEWYNKNWTYSIGGGIGRYKPMQQEDRHIGDNSMPNLGGSRINYTPIIELSVSYGKTTMTISYQTITEYGDWEDDTPKSATITTWIRYRF